jgi:hypothetical protein
MRCSARELPAAAAACSNSSQARTATTRRRMRCSARELPVTRRWPNPRAIPRARVPGGALDGEHSGQCTYFIDECHRPRPQH